VTMWQLAGRRSADVPISEFEGADTIRAMTITNESRGLPALGYSR
jgi:hypothetical protein